MLKIARTPLFPKNNEARDHARAEEEEATNSHHQVARTYDRARPPAARQTDAPDALVGALQILAQHSNHLHTDLRMLAQEFHQLFSANKDNPGRVE